MAYHLKEGQISGKYVVEVDLRILPGVVEIGLCVTFWFVEDDFAVDGVSFFVDARLESTAEQIHSHDAKDQPENETYQQDVEDRWNSLDQSVDDNLYATTRDRPKPQTKTVFKSHCAR